MVNAKENDDCCLTYSISSSEDGISHRWPLVKREGGCSGGFKKTFQQWVDYTVSEYESYGFGLCFEGWRYLSDD